MYYELLIKYLLIWTINEYLGLNRKKRLTKSWEGGGAELICKLSFKGILNINWMKPFANLHWF